MKKRKNVQLQKKGLNVLYSTGAQTRVGKLSTIGGTGVESLSGYYVLLLLTIYGISMNLNGGAVQCAAYDDHGTSFNAT